MKCTKCEKELELKKKDDTYYYYCEACKIGGKGANASEAESDFPKFPKKSEQEKSGPDKNKSSEKKPETKPETKPKTNQEKKSETEIVSAASSLIFSSPPAKTEFLGWVEKNISELYDYAAQFLDKPKTLFIIRKNAKYIMNSAIDEVWQSEQGRESIVEAFNYANSLGAQMPQMGCILKFKNYQDGKTVHVVNFIPDESAYRFALTCGRNPLFESIAWSAIYSNDQYDTGYDQFNNFYFTNKPRIPRGDIIGVAVWGKQKSNGATIGKVFDKKMILAKAAQSSSAYKYYLKDMEDLARARTEKKDYIEKFGKKFTEADITTNYIGANEEEMYVKLAVKSFFNRYVKTINSYSALDEWGEDETPAKNNPVEDSISKAIDYTTIKDAETK